MMGRVYVHVFDVCQWCVGTEITVCIVAELVQLEQALWRSLTCMCDVKILRIYNASNKSRRRKCANIPKPAKACYDKQITVTARERARSR